MSDEKEIDKLDTDNMRMWWKSTNYYLIMCDDPGMIEVMDERKLVHTLAESLAWGGDGYHLSESDYTKPTAVEGEFYESSRNKDHKSNVKDIKEIMDWLNQDFYGTEREPSPYFIKDECAYNYIRRIARHED
jgi:hypothetical protein